MSCLHEQSTSSRGSTSIEGWPASRRKIQPEAVAWLFLSLEAAIVSVADRHGLATMKQHWKKAEVAAELHSTGVLPHDFSETLRILNEARKVATYDGDEPDLEGQSLEDIATDVEVAVDLAEKEARA